MARASLDNSAYYLNREASWLAFNRRVLEEAQDENNPLLERLKFLSITASNLDEFFEVRVAGLVQQIEDGYTEAGPDGLTLVEERDLVSRETHDFVDDQYRCWNEKLRPAMHDRGIRVLGLHELDSRARAFVEEYCERELDLLLTPVTVDPAHPFPRVINKALCVAFLLRRRRRSSLTYTGVVTVPRALPRLVRLPSDGTDDFIFLADLVTHHAASMYRGYDIISSAAFRVTRNSNLYLAEEESRNLLESVRTELHNRRKGDAVRLEIEADADPEIIERLRVNFELEPWQVFSTNGPVNLSRLLTIYEHTGHPELKFKAFVPRELRLTAKSQDLFEELRRHDVLLHHPFDAYDAVVSFIESAAEDDRVLSVKQTLYRTNEHSLIVPALIAAAAQKEVTAVVELKARFDYTDLSLLTADPEITAALHDVFSFLTAYAEHPNYEPLMVAPLDLAERCLALIAREAEHARHGRPARIIAKMNAVLDKNIIMALYRASQAGVKIDLIVRGMCALRPGVRGVSDNISVRSIVGRFLEHSRIFCFANGGQEEVYLGSADWMPRNLYERVEVIYPVKDALLRERVKNEILEAYLADNLKARVLQKDGSYIRAWQAQGKRKPPSGSAAFNAQEFLIAVAEGKQPLEAIPPEPPKRVRRPALLERER